MSMSKINGKDIEAYVTPELETLHAILRGLHLSESLKALILFRSIFEAEIRKARRTPSRPKKEKLVP